MYEDEGQEDYHSHSNRQVTIQCVCFCPMKCKAAAIRINHSETAKVWQGNVHIPSRRCVGENREPSVPQ